jgi:GT2 family glycosyltransferase
MFRAFKITVLAGKMIVYLYVVTLSILIVNYNVKELLEHCLISISKAVKSNTFEVLVVDNASTDGTRQYLPPKFPGHKFIFNEHNVGFAKANNQALRVCRGEFVLFLNPDTVLPALSLDKCIAFMHDHPDAGALGVRMVDQHSRFLRESKRGLPTPSASFWKLMGFATLFPKSVFFSSYYASHVGEFETSPVDVLSGAFMLVRKNVLDLVGGFDERFFMYAEDIDLSYRILKAGYQNYYYPQVTITHLKGSSTKKDARYVQQFYKAMSQYVRKHHGNGPFSWLLNTGIFCRGVAAAVINAIRPARK